MIVKQSHVTMTSEHHKESSVTVVAEGGLTIEEAKAKAFASEMDISLLDILGPDYQGRAGAGAIQSSLSAEERLDQAVQAQRKLFASLIDALFSKVGRKSSLLTDMSAANNAASPADSTLVMNADGVTTAGQTGEVVANQPGGLIPVMPTINVKVDVSMTETIEEYECSSFSACGVVKTADGREIDMNLNVSMERSYKATREYSETMEYTFTDPLVLHFEGHSSELSEESYDFDLNMDGEDDSLKFIEGVSAFLALDRNKDGVINDGSELFGAKSGNGFADLAAYDDDGNGYIDEADAIFSELQLWSKATDGGDIFESLTERGVGAIYLGASETPFDIKNSSNEMQGRVVASGFFLKESGEVGTVQQIDMVS